MDDAEGVEEGVNRVDDEQEERCRCQKREHDRPEASRSARAVDRRGLDQRFRDRLQAGDEEKEIVADLFPGRRNDDQHHGLIAVQKRIPGKAVPPQDIGKCAHRRVEHEEP
ncbi:hypothetical protein D3C87_1768900 [compost metagenome]